MSKTINHIRLRNTMIIAILNQKGGSGKTTISVNLAHALQLTGDSVLLVDSDPQGSARDWHAASDESPLTVIGLDRPTLSKDILKFRDNYDWIIVDGAPQLENMAIAAIRSADIILIPVQPSPYDVWATEDLVEVINARHKVTDGLPKTAFIISRRIRNTTLGKEIKDALDGYGLPVFENGTYQRIGYAKTAATGRTVFTDESNRDASLEISKLASELKSFCLDESHKGSFI
jgi:chromosome partitioning protein